MKLSTNPVRNRIKYRVKIRYANSKDINKVIELWSEFMEEHHKFFKLGIHPTQENIRRIKKWFRKRIKSKELIEAEYNQKLVGYILFDKQKFPLEKDFIIGYIHDVFVKREYRSLGIGEKLINKVHQIFKRKKYNRVGLQVIYQNRKAIKLYKKLGYKNGSLGMYKLLK